MARRGKIMAPGDPCTTPHRCLRTACIAFRSIDHTKGWTDCVTALSMHGVACMHACIHSDFISVQSLAATAARLWSASGTTGHTHQHLDPAACPATLPACKSCTHADIMLGLISRCTRRRLLPPKTCTRAHARTHPRTASQPASQPSYRQHTSGETLALDKQS